MCARVSTLCHPPSFPSHFCSVLRLCVVEFNPICFCLFVFHDIIYDCERTPQCMGGKLNEEKQN